MSIDASVYFLFCLNSFLAIDIFGYFYIMATMLYVLHHPKGALLLRASDRDQVLQWSRRQLGARAALVSIYETDGMDSVENVERSGTGMKAMEADGCRPVISIMANFDPMSPAAGEDHMESDPLLSGPCVDSRMLTLH